MNLVNELNSKRDIKVTYTGRYPNMCRGTLIIEVNGQIIYSEDYVTESTGSCGFNHDYSESYIDSGTLIWDPEHARQFPQYIRDAVEDELSKFDVCCGGCL